MAAGRVCPTCSTTIFPHERCTCGNTYEMLAWIEGAEPQTPPTPESPHHPSSSEFSPQCQFCEQLVWERIVVPATIHPDQQLFVCETHADFIASVGLTIEDLVNPDPF